MAGEGGRESGGSRDTGQATTPPSLRGGAAGTAAPRGHAREAALPFPLLRLPVQGVAPSRKHDGPVPRQAFSRPQTRVGPGL